MKFTARHILTAVFGAMLAGGIVCALIAGSAVRESVVCNALDVVILDSLDNSFVNKADIRRYLDREYGKYLEVPADSIDLSRIEKIIDGRSAVLKSQAYMTSDGVLHIDVTQRKPVARFVLPDGGFYADEEGFIFPLQRNYASHVQVIDGDIPIAANSGYKGRLDDPKQEKWLRQVISLVNFIKESKTWKDKFVQISSDADGELILIPREGQERFLIGQPVKLEDKFSRMEKYYTSIVPEKGKDYYRYVDLRFNGQIVCRQK